MEEDTATVPTLSRNGANTNRAMALSLRSGYASFMRGVAGVKYSQRFVCMDSNHNGFILLEILFEMLSAGV